MQDTVVIIYLSLTIYSVKRNLKRDFLSNEYLTSVNPRLIAIVYLETGYVQIKLCVNKFLITLKFK
jgi:hypothetical protein